LSNRNPFKNEPTAFQAALTKPDQLILHGGKVGFEPFDVRAVNNLFKQITLKPI
jgi:hypothetical protein